MSSEAPTQHRYLYLDGWRGLSILAVLVGHFFSLPGINAGRFGVEMFFVLSGRLMAEILFIKQVDIATFFKRRVSRVWPALFAFVLIAWAVFHFRAGDLHVTVQAALVSITFTYNYLLSYVGRSPVLDHIWSLCVEEHIYLILGLMAFFSRKYRVKPLLPLAVIAVFFIANGVYQTYFLQQGYYEVYWRTDVRGASILMAVCVYLVLQRNKCIVANWVPIVFFLLGMLLSVDKVPDPIKYSLGSLCLAISIVTINHLASFWIKLISHPIITRIGLISFSLYLWQQPFYELLGTYPKPILLLMLMVTATLSYYFVETPARNFLNKRWK